MNTIPTPAQLAELNRLHAAVDADDADRLVKVESARNAAAALSEATEADAQARADLQVAEDKENTDLIALKEFLVRLFDPVVGLDVEVSPPHERVNTMQCKVVKKSHKMAVKSSPKGPIKATGFVIQDNEDGTFTVFGMDAAGAGGIDVSTVATLTPPPTSADTTVLTLDTPTGMTASYHGLKPGTTKVGIDAAWNDASVGPFHIDVDATVTTGPATGLDVQFSNPVVRP